MNLTLTYFYQSGFAIGVNKSLLVFSYYENKDIADESLYRLSTSELRAFESIYFFIPNICREHLEPAIFADEFKALPVKYIISSDVVERHVANTVHIKNINAYVDSDKVIRAEVGDRLSFPEMQVEVCKSSGLGVSFFIRLPKLNIFHAGDLNNWHWCDEQDEAEAEKARLSFVEAVNSLPDEPIDLCMFPVDPKLGGQYQAGARAFMANKKIKVFVPMHWHDEYDRIMEFARASEFSESKICLLCNPRDSVIIDFSGETPRFKKNTLISEDESGILSLNNAI